MDRLSRAWGTVSHLKAVKDTEELRKVGGRCRRLGAPSCPWWLQLGARLLAGRAPCAWCGGAALKRRHGRMGAALGPTAAATQPASRPCSPPRRLAAASLPPTHSPQAVEEVQRERVKLSLRLSQSKPL